MPVINVGDFDLPDNEYNAVFEEFGDIPSLKQFLYSSVKSFIISKRAERMKQEGYAQVDQQVRDYLEGLNNNG